MLTIAANASNVPFKIADAKLYVLVVALSAENNLKLVKQLNEEFKRPVYWNKYKVIDNKVVAIAAANAEKHIRELLDSSYQGVKRLFVLAFDNAAIYDQLINDLIKQYNKVRKVLTRQGDDYTAGCLLDCAYFEKKKKIRLIAVDLNKQKALDAGSRAIRQIIFTGKIKSTVANTRVIMYYILEQSKKYNFLKEQQKFCK